MDTFQLFTLFGVMNDILNLRSLFASEILKQSLIVTGRIGLQF